MDRGSTPSGPDEPGRQERAIVRLLPTLRPLTAPDARARDRMRERILAGLAAPQPDDSVPTPADRGAAKPRPTPRPSHGPRGAAPETRRPGERPDRRKGMAGARGRFAIAAVALLALVFSLAGMSLLLARDALPGDPLYGIKRTAEAASLGLTFGDESKALKHLEFASARVNEIETLTQRYPNPSGAPVGGYLGALTDFDNDASAGSRQLIALATRNDGRQLDSLRAWADQQAERLNAVAARLPAPARNREGASLALLDKISSRSAALRARMVCYQITTGSFDDVGALPATGTCERVPGASTDPPISSSGAGSPGQATAPALTTVPAGPGQQPLPGQQVPGQPVPSGPLSATVPPTGGADPADPAPPGTDLAQPPSLVIPLPLPTIDVPPLLPGLPGIRIGM